MSLVAKLFDNKCGIIQRKAAKKKLSISNKMAIKKNSLIRQRKKTKIPKRNYAQKAKIRSIGRKLYYKYKYFVWVLDDESYFSLNNSEINGNDNFSWCYCERWFDIK